MNETDFYTNNFFLVEHNAQLLYDDSNSVVREVRRIMVIHYDKTCIMYLDERFNDLEFRGFDNITGQLFSKNREEDLSQIIDYLTEKYQELKNFSNEISQKLKVSSKKFQNIFKKGSEIIQK